MRAVVMGTLFVASVLGADGDCIERPCQVATNVADRMTGEIDLRPGQFGLAQAVNHDIEFYPPEGYRTRIVRLHGDFTAVFVEVDGPEPLATIRYDPTFRSYILWAYHYYAGVLTSFRHTGPEGSPHGFPLADNAMLYRQRFLHNGVPAAAVDYSEDIWNGLLRSDNILRIVHAVFNNTSKKSVQMETTVQILFQFEPIDLEQGARNETRHSVCFSCLCRPRPIGLQLRR